VTWFTSDWHLGDPRQKILGRPFQDEIEAFKEMKKLHNSLVSPDDTVYFVGDAVYQKADKPLEWLEAVEEFNGKKYLCRGNHDRIFTDEELLTVFEDVVAEDDGYLVKVPRLVTWVTHYPSQGKEEYFNLVGHIHSAWKFQLNMANIGVDVHHFRPVNENEIADFLNAITNFYDEDVWIAYNEINYNYHQKRGKKSRYLK
jgi:calcineurin-like phosphoesterase family protein